MVSKCIVCDTRPRKRGAYCGACADKIERETQAQDERKTQARYYITYRGIVVGVYPDGEDDAGRVYRARLERVEPETVPQSRLIDVNTYLPGYTRDQIAKFKRTCLSLAHA